MNQYRCETCKNHIYERETYCDFCIAKPLIKYRIVPNEMYIINHLGCASHSDFQSERDTIFEMCQQRGIELSDLHEKCDNLELELSQVSQSERDKVLDEILKFSAAYSQGLPGFIYVYNLEEKIAELRQQAGEP
jgi:hypothetical protein